MIIFQQNWRQIKSQRVVFEQCNVVTRHVRLRDEFEYEATGIEIKSSTKDQSIENNPQQ